MSVKIIMTIITMTSVNQCCFSTMVILLIMAQMYKMITTISSHVTENKPQLMHELMTIEERMVLLGHAKHVPPYQLISSVDITEQPFSTRSKRSTTNQNQPLRVEFEALGEQFRLMLWPNHGLLSPNFHVLNAAAPVPANWSTGKQLSDCFYQGYDQAHEHGAAAISLCNGMQGVIETNPSIYMINPVPDRLLNSTNGHQRYHLVLKRNHLDEYNCPHDRPTNIRSKRSIDIAASNRNFLDADKTTTSVETTSTTEQPNLANETHNALDETKANERETSSFNITVETAVFVDESLYHVLWKTFPVDTEQQIVLYVLTIMNAVQLLFKQPSLGRSVDISVVLMDLLRQQPKSLTPSDNIDTYLTNFCVWQHKKRLKETGGATPDWDHALLLSGINMYVVDGYGRRKRHVVGLAPVSGMCNSLNSCTISEGTNFQTVLVAGHEMGHSLGMEHDGDQDGNSCNKDHFVMSPTLGPGKTTWSQCSKDYLDKFVLTPQATCVLGRSSHVNIIQQFIPAQRLPGERFNVDEQCRFRFGPMARHHSSQHKSEICRVIKCYVKAGYKQTFYSGRPIYPYPVKSTYNTHPALEGSECGLDKWCRQGRCVAKPLSPLSYEMENNLILARTNPYIATIDNSFNKTEFNKDKARPISQRHKKRPTKQSNKQQPDFIETTTTTSTSTSANSIASSTESSIAIAAPSTVLIVDNIYKSSTINSTETNHEHKSNPYNQMSTDWHSSRMPAIPVNGNWSQWSQYGPCISECVAPGSTLAINVPLGVQTSFRRCNKPSPMNGGQYCLGPDTRVRLCNAIEVCSSESAISASKLKTIGGTLSPRQSGKRYEIRTVQEYISDTCLAAAKFNNKIQTDGTQYPSYDSPSHSCYVWCFQRTGGLMTQGWRLPDGTPCGRKLNPSDEVELSGFCYNGQCRPFNCHAEMFVSDQSTWWSASSNVYNGNFANITGPEWSHLEHELFNENCPQTDYKMSQVLHDLNNRWQMENQTIKPTTITNSKQNLTIVPRTDTATAGTSSYHLSSNWSDWQPVTECQYSIGCIQHAVGFRLVTRECQKETCLGRREALQICADVASGHSESPMYQLYEQYCPSSSRLSADDYAQQICRKYQMKFSSLLSGNGRQLNHGCIVACEDRLWKDIHYQMDAFDDGKLPFGTDCSHKHRTGYCLNGKCIHFDQNGISYDTTESVLYRNEILQLFGPSSSTGPYRSMSDLSGHSNSLYTAIYNNEFYKRASAWRHLEEQPAYQSFISSRRRFKRHLTSWSFGKEPLQDQTEPEADYVSWTMIRQTSAKNSGHHGQYRRPIIRTMKKSILHSGQNFKPSIRPIKLTSVRRTIKSKQLNQAKTRHFATFTLVKPRSRLGKNAKMLANQNEHLAMPLNHQNDTKFLDDNTKHLNDQTQLNKRKQMVKFGLGHESWPPSVLDRWPIKFLDDDDDDDSDGEADHLNHSTDSPEPSDGGELRVEPYVWSVILSECNRVCGLGIRTVRVVCTVAESSVSEDLCDAHSKPMHKPIESCKQRDCIGKWRAEPWSKCFTMTNRTCESFQSRTIACVGPMVHNGGQTEPISSDRAASQSPPRRVFSLLSHDYCDPSTKPIQWKPCILDSTTTNALKCNSS